MKSDRAQKQIAMWLYIGVIMLLVQILLGGITRLTQSGLSITEWKPVTGILPPLNEVQWQEEFSKYKNTSQFQYLHQHFSISDFKFIFFWEWLHRAWARLLGLVFLIGFFYFLFTKKFKKEMVIPFIILFLLGLVQAVIGWIMVKSGLVPTQMFVGHIQLATHFIAALFLLCYTWWFALSISLPRKITNTNSGVRNWTYLILFFLFFQLIYGAFMAGLHAAVVAPTWPLINGHFLPPSFSELMPFYKNLFYNKLMIQFIHRSLGYLLFILVMVWYFKVAGFKGNRILNKMKWVPFSLIIIQVALGIITVVSSPYDNNLLWFGVAHQLVAILFLMSVVLIIFLLRKSKHTFQVHAF